MFKKAINSEGFVVVGNNKSDKPYPIGFEYSVGEMVYKVTKDISNEAEMRRLECSDGTQEDVEISTIKKDLKEHGAKILNYGELEDKEENKEDKEENE